MPPCADVLAEVCGRLKSKGVLFVLLEFCNHTEFAQ